MNVQPSVGPRARKIFYSGVEQAYVKVTATITAALIDIRRKLDEANEEILNEEED